MARIKVHKLQEKTRAELKSQLEELKAELSLLRVAKVTRGAPNKLSTTEVVRTAIAPLLTEISRKQKAALREACKNEMYHPLDLRPNSQEEPCNSPLPHHSPGQEQWEAIEEEGGISIESLSLKTEGNEA